MPQIAVCRRWQAAVAQAARQVLLARWRSSLDSLEQARSDYRRLSAAGVPEAGALRKAVQRIRALEQVRGVLARELSGAHGRPPY